MRYRSDIVTGRLFEFFDALTEAFCQFGQLLGAEQEQDNRQNENQFPSTDESSDHKIHKFAICQKITPGGGISKAVKYRALALNP